MWRSKMEKRKRVEEMEELNELSSNLTTTDITMSWAKIFFKCHFPQYSEILIYHAHAKENKF